MMEADTVCLHGDGQGAAVFALGLRTALLAAGVQLRALV
jgi:lactam utilization protein B